MKLTLRNRTFLKYIVLTIFLILLIGEILEV